MLVFHVLYNWSTNSYGNNTSMPCACACLCVRLCVYESMLYAAMHAVCAPTNICVWKQLNDRRSIRLTEFDSIGWHKSNNVIKHKQVKLFACGNIRSIASSLIRCRRWFSDVFFVFFSVVVGSLFLFVRFLVENRIAAATAATCHYRRSCSCLLTRPKEWRKQNKNTMKRNANTENQYLRI